MTSTLQATGGDNDWDEHAAMAAARAGSDGIWRPECWSKSPEQMVEEARMMNNAAFAHACAMAGKHSNPPNMPWQRDT